MSNAVAKTAFKDVLSSMVSKGAKSFPKGVNAERLKINALMYISQDTKLAQLANANPMRIAQYVYNFVALGLDMLNRECYIIPYGSKLTVIKDYKGEVKLAKSYSIDPIREIFARVVYANDKYLFDNENKFVHSFDPFNMERGEKIGAFCTVIYENGVQQTEFVNVEEINKVKSVSQSANSEFSPWVKWEEEMWKKTVIRKAMKNISLDFGSTETQKAYSESDNDLDLTRSAEAAVIDQGDAFDTIDHESDVKAKRPDEATEEVDIHDV